MKRTLLITALLFIASTAFGQYNVDDNGSLIAPGEVGTYVKGSVAAARQAERNRRNQEGVGTKMSPAERKKWEEMQAAKLKATQEQLAAINAKIKARSEAIQQAKTRTWTSTSGSTILATFVKQSGTTITLSTDTKQITLELSQLIESDQEYITKRKWETTDVGQLTKDERAFLLAQQPKPKAKPKAKKVK